VNCPMAMFNAMRIGTIQRLLSSRSVIISLVMTNHPSAAMATVLMSMSTDVLNDFLTTV
jgi:hypothetical protein